MKIIKFNGLVFDYSRTFLTKKHMAALAKLTRERKLFQRRDEMFSGKKINLTSQTAALHTALRASGRNQPAANNRRRPHPCPCPDPVLGESDKPRP